MVPISRVIVLTVDSARKHGEASKTVRISPSMHQALIAESTSALDAIHDLAIEVDENCPPGTVIIGKIAADWSGYAH